MPMVTTKSLIAQRQMFDLMDASSGRRQRFIKGEFICNQIYKYSYISVYSCCTVFLRTRIHTVLLILLNVI